MKKKYKKNKSTKKSKNKEQFKYICSSCNKDMKAKMLDDGYVICAYCGMVLIKQKYSLENIDAPGFKKVYLNKKINKKNKIKKNRNKHHNLVVMKNYIKKFKKR